jgi:uncharacterized protein (DUF1800 family)
MNSLFRRVLAAMALAWVGIASTHAAGPSAEVNYQGLWWNAPAGSEAGWGINFAHQGDIIFATWFTYDASGKPWWLIAEAHKTAPGVYSGDVSTVTGSPFGVVPFDSKKKVETVVGSTTFTFADRNSGSFAYTVNGIAQTKPIIRQVFASPVPTCVWGAQPDLALATNYQDLWWNAPAESEAGWGINFTHQGDIIFATWFTYDSNGKPWWLIAEAHKSAPGVYAGEVSTVTGPAFNATPFDPGKKVETVVGSTTLTFADGNHASFRYTVNGFTQTKQITRQVFVAPGTVCSTPSPAERKDAARFLRQATFGATREAIDALVAQGYDAWLTEQFATPAVSHLATVKADPRLPEMAGAVTMPSLWKQYFEGTDQLRQRVSNALSQIFVVSFNNDAVGGSGCGGAAYLDVLNRGAFGNARTLLRDVTLSPAMGEYLSMKGSAKADPVLQTQPDENYAREVMQLLSVGLVMLNIDGTAQQDGNGKPLPTYNEDTVKGFAKALSGWTYAGQDQTKPWRWLYPDLYDPDPVIRTAKACPAWSEPMQPWIDAYRAADDKRNIPGTAHDAEAKQLLVYPGAPHSTLPAAQSAQTDLENVIDNLFNHPNVGPFLGKQLIQRLVTSNPSPQYVERVARKFNDNGSGVRGDMKAVVRAILLDDDARSPAVASQPSFGKLTEPVMRFVQFHRAFNARRVSGYYDLWDFSAPTALNQSPLHAPSVFNFYHPDFAPAGPLTEGKLVGPEFEITSASSVAGFADFSKYAILPGFEYYNKDKPGNWIAPDFSYYLGLANSPAALVDELDLVLCSAGVNPMFKTQIVQSVGKVLWPQTEPERSVERLYVVLWLLLNSPDCSVQK